MKRKNSFCKWGYRFGVPTLLMFLFTGMLFGSDTHEDYRTNSATSVLNGVNSLLGGNKVN